MKDKVTVEQKQRELIEEAAQASRKCFTALREARAWGSRCVLLGMEEWKFVASLKVKNQWESPDWRIFARRSRLLPMQLLDVLNELPLDEMETDAKTARAEMLAIRNGNNNRSNAGNESDSRVRNQIPYSLERSKTRAQVRDYDQRRHYPRPIR
jgi:hypothetical protein